jgi:hypothetical protein
MSVLEDCAVKTYMGYEDKAPHILNLTTRLR